jgi:hypothetical protein
MRQELQIWRSEAGSRFWLSSLIAAMNEVAEAGPSDLDADILARFRAQLSLPTPIFQAGSIQRH